MSGIIGISSVTLTDLNDAAFSATPPRNPEPNDIWVDNSTTPAIIKVYENGNWKNANIDVEQLDPDLAETIEFVTGTLGNIADDNKLTFADRQIVLNNISTIIGSLPSSSSSAQSTLPTYLTLDAGGSGTFSRYRQTAREVGVETNSSVYRNVQNTYTSLASYLQGFSPRPWDVTNGNKNAVTNLDSGNTFRQKFLDYYLAELALVEETEVLAKQLAEEYTDANVSDTVHEETEWQYPLITDKAHENGGVELDIEGNKDGVGSEIEVVSNRGGRNYFSQSNYSHHSNTGYNASSWTSAIVEADPNTEYTISYTVTESNRLGVTHDPLSNGIYANYTDPITLAGYINTSQGDEVSVTVKTPNREGYLVLYLSNQGNGIKEPYLMVEKGNKATDWTPAPEDIQYDTITDGVYKTKIKLDAPLRGNDSVRDTIEKGTDGKYYIHRRVNSANEILSTPTVEPVSDEVQGKLDRIPTFTPSTHIYTVTTPTPRFRGKFKSRMWAEEQRRITNSSGVANQFNASDLIDAGTQVGDRIEVEIPTLTPGERYIISTNAPEDQGVQFTTPDATFEVYEGNPATFIAQSDFLYAVSIPIDNVTSFTGYTEENPNFTGGGYIIQLERGDYPTDLKLSDIDAIRREEDNRKELEKNLLSVFDAGIETTEKSIQAYVNETVFGLDENGNTVEEAGLEYQLSSLVQQTANQFDISFGNLEKVVLGEDENDENSIEYRLSEVRSNFTFYDDGRFEISAPGSGASLELTNKGINFKNGDNVVAYVEANEMRINKGVFVDSLTVDSYKFEMRGDYGVWSYEPRN